MTARWRHWLAEWLVPPVAPAPEEDAHDPARGVSLMALAEASGSYGRPLVAFQLPQPAPGVIPSGIAMDSGIPQLAAQAASQLMSFGLASRFHEGMAFLGFPYLAELAQRPEYRKISETIAKDATRKWIKLNGPSEAKLKELETALNKHGVQEKFRALSEQDGFFGRSQLFIDNGETDLRTTLVISPSTIGKGKLKSLTVVEPVWTYPGQYNADKPLQPDFYQPREWYVMGDIVSNSRLLTFVAREVPDMLKATYSFGGLSMSQMAKPYVDNWLRTRQSISDLLHSFSTMVLKTDMGTVLQGGAAQSLINRIGLFNRFRDNRGTMAIDKDSEELENISTPLGTLDALQAQAQEQMASVSSIPLVVLLGITPSGLNASSDGEIRTYYGTIKAYQEHFFRPHLKTVIEIVQLDLWGAIDSAITFEFLPLWEMDETAAAAIRKSDAEADVGYVNAGIIDPEEARERLSEDEQGLYFGVDLSAPAPEAPDDEAALTDGAEGLIGSKGLRSKAANDSIPAPLYVRRQVLNVEEIRAWADGQGIPVTEDLHVTLMSTPSAVDWMAMGESYAGSDGILLVGPGGPRVVEPLGDKGAVLLFASNELSARWWQMKEAGAVPTHDEYQPHISISRHPLTGPVTPYRGQILLGPEIFEPAKVA